MDYGCQLYNTLSARRLKKLDSIHRKGIRIYTGPFGTSSVEALELRRNELGFLYKLKSNTSYLNTKYIEQQTGPKLRRKMKGQIKSTGV